MIETLKAPWTQEQVDNLDDYQENIYIHPYTCGDCFESLEPFTDGWVCLECGYRQDWCHADHANESWKDYNPMRQLDGRE